MSICTLHLLIYAYDFLVVFVVILSVVDSFKLRRNRRHFADDILKCVFLNENVLISFEISLKFIPKGPVYNIPALVQIMAWRRPGDKPLSEAMIFILMTHICVTWPQLIRVTHFLISFRVASLVPLPQYRLSNPEAHWWIMLLQNHNSANFTGYTVHIHIYNMFYDLTNTCLQVISSGLELTGPL